MRVERSPEMRPYFITAPVETMTDIYQIEIRLGAPFPKFTWDDSPGFRIGDDGSVWYYGLYA